MTKAFLITAALLVGIPFALPAFYALWCKWTDLLDRWASK